MSDVPTFKLMTDTNTTIDDAPAADVGSGANLASVIASLRPLNRLPKHAVDALVKQATLYQASVGETIKSRVMDEKAVHFLIEGTVQLFTENGKSETLFANDPNAKNALGKYAKSTQDMIANCPSTLVLVPWESLEKYLIQYAPAELSSTLEVQEILSSTSSDWMVRLLQSDLFSLLPPNNIQKVLSSIDFIDTVPEDVIITEGEAGKHFYIVDHGDFLVSKQNTKTGGEVELASLSSGDFFGEEALITDSPRGATVTSTSVGRLIRLNNETFKSFIVAPAVPLLSADSAKSLVGKGAEFIDIREPKLYASGAIPNSANLMLTRLRSNSEALDKQRIYVVVDDTPNSARHAAFLLRAKGFDARCLNLPLEKYAVLQGIDLTNDLYNPNTARSDSTDALTLNEARDGSPDNEQTSDIESTFEKIGELTSQHAAFADDVADKKNYAHTLTGTGLADLIEELNETYDEREKSDSEPIAASVVLEKHIDSQGELVDSSPTGMSVEFLDEQDEEQHTNVSQEPEAQYSAETLHALNEQRITLTKDFERKLFENQQAARKAIRHYKNKLAAEHREKQRVLLNNSKKLITLANKISQQKVEVQRARNKLMDEHRLINFSAAAETRADITASESDLVPTDSANNCSWSTFLRTVKI